MGCGEWMLGVNEDELYGRRGCGGKGIRVGMMA